MNEETEAKVQQAILLYRDERLSLGETADRMGVTREYVRLLLNRGGVTARHRGAARRERIAAKNADKLAALVADPEGTRALYLRCGSVYAFARHAGVTVKVAQQARDAVMTRDEQRLERAYHSSPSTDEQLQGYLRQAVAEHGEPIPALAYTGIAQREGWPSNQTFLLRWGTWRNACLTCGVAANPRSGPSQRWTTDACWNAVKTLQAEMGGQVPSYKQYERWAAGNPDRPSGALVRRRVGGWRQVIATLGHARVAQR